MDDKYSEIRAALDAEWPAVIEKQLRSIKKSGDASCFKAGELAVDKIGRASCRERVYVLV